MNSRSTDNSYGAFGGEGVFSTITGTPTGYAGVVLLAQAANIGNDTRTISFSHERSVSGIAVTTEIVKDLPIPANDTANLLAGKLVLETDDILVISSNSGTNVKFISSILETLK